MSYKAIVYVVCDGCDAEYAYRPQYPAVSQAVLRNARDQARESGWRYVHPAVGQAAGRDLCPGCYSRKGAPQ